jgi:EpsI family protein
MALLKQKYTGALLVLLSVQAVAFYTLAFRSENIPAVPPLVTFPEQLGTWHMAKEIPVEKEVADILRADDTLNRVYIDPVRGDSYLWIAYFKTQRYGQTPHSPKNCLPGSGWEPVPGASGPLTISVAGWDTPITINRYVVQHGDERSVSLYWYQSRGRVVAGEMAAKFWLVADSIRYRRSDTALIRVTVPVRRSVDDAVATAVEFVRWMFPVVMRQMPL